MMRRGISWAAAVAAAMIAFSTPGMAESRAARGLAPGAAEPAPSSSFPFGDSKTASGTPSFSVDPSVEQGRPGDRVTLSFASNDPVWAIVACRAGFGEPPLTCSGSRGSDWSVELTVPANAAPGPTSIPWRLFYEPDNTVVINDASPSYQDGATPFVVLPPVAASPSDDSGGFTRDGSGGAASALPSSPSPAGSLPPAAPRASASKDRSFPIGVPLLLVVLAAAALAAALIGRHRRVAAAATLGAGAFAGAPTVPRAVQSVRAVPRRSPATEVNVREGPAGHTHVVRIVPHPHVGTVEVREVRR